MPNKRTKKCSKNSGISIANNQPNISKYFISDSSYPTSFLKKRHAANEDTNEHSPTKKILKLFEKRDSSNISQPCVIPEATSEKLHSFSFKKTITDEERIFNPESSSGANKSLKGNDEKCCLNPVSETIEDIESNAVSEQQAVSNSRVKYTPLEKQYLNFKEKYSDAILLIECGYKYKLFDKDAEIVSKLFNLAYFKSHNFMSARVLASRLYFYVQQLVLKGYKVGVIKQTETAAIKAAGNTKNDLFTRELDAMYTKSTLIGEEFAAACSENIEDSFSASNEDMSSGYLMCIYEEPSPISHPNLNIAFVAIQASSGDVTYASFQDSALRNILETYLIHINPAEILLPSSLSKETENLISNFSTDRLIRTEKIPQDIFDITFALDSVSSFYTEEGTEPKNSTDLKQTILSLPSPVISCLSALIPYLTKFKLEGFLKHLNYIKPLSTNDDMILSSTTLKGLDILTNSSSHKESGSLFWVLNRTMTKFGERLLKNWIAKPLKKYCLLEERLNIVTEIIHSDSIVFKIVERILYKLPDLERILCNVFYQKCSCLDFLKLLQAFSKIKEELQSADDKIDCEVESPRLKIIFSDLPQLLNDVERFLSNIDQNAAKEGDKNNVFRDTSLYPDLQTCHEEIASAEQSLNNLKPEICKVLKLINFKYATVNCQKYLIEVPTSHLRSVPKTWLKISSTKQFSRFKSPEVIELSNKIEQIKERMKECASKAWSSFLNDFGASFFKHKRAISHLAELDCYFSLAKVAKQENYCRPDIVNSGEQVFHVLQGQHPILKKIMGEENQYVANDITMNANINCIIVTGPNMGGKSTYVRQTALIAIMAQIGSYVPAEAVRMSLFDKIYARMGAEDTLSQGRSTFLNEMSETSEILRNCTSKSFVILDELGRGTSTNDGAAIAYASLEYLISKMKCFTMFVTHYPSIIELKTVYPDAISVVHMGYILKDKDDETDIESVTFLYNVVHGRSKKSYGINVAALAGIPKNILLEAQEKSQTIELKATVQKKISELFIKLRRCKQK
ncbi:hypothetical protein JTE90_020188 [Oedothorax gibbosus]|uniref:DNA mismatch repair protein MSH3 n=1 Tax=Oedothorax gibbosus TaxID=931172 RepID=A0AAV6U1T0_9ARAC|nr:hypothetical protein JTE90_020188 [Oedothorax gibbosus]